MFLKGDFSQPVSGMWLQFTLDFSVHSIYSLYLSVPQLHTLLCNFCTQYPAQMETSGLLVEQAILKVVWRFVTAILGAQCVMTVGTPLMQMWPVDNLDLVNQVSDLEFDCFRLQRYRTCWRQDLHVMPFVKVFTS